VLIHNSILPYCIGTFAAVCGARKGSYGKIDACMNANEPLVNVTPPRLFPTLQKGFNTVAGKVHLILIPLLVDLFLWLGPKLRIYDLFTPLVKELTGTMASIAPKEMLDAVNATTTLYSEFLTNFNLFTVVRTVPVGVPSLLARMNEIAAPLNLAGLIEAPSVQAAIGIFGALLLLGFFLGTLYFDAIARQSQPENVSFSLKRLFSEYTQTLVFFLIIIALVLMIAAPVFIMISVFSLINPALAQFVLFMLLFLVMWLALPLVFSPHGIFALEQKVVPSMLLSMRMVRFFVPGTSLFILFCILISEGMNMLWVIPGGESWLLALGIGGHAFVVTALLCASFFYYRDGLKWMQFNIQTIQDQRNKQESRGTPLE
jgi:hypothetical protein